jgi:hypothetical protein
MFSAAGLYRQFYLSIAAHQPNLTIILMQLSQSVYGVNTPYTATCQNREPGKKTVGRIEEQTRGQSVGEEEVKGRII